MRDTLIDIRRRIEAGEYINEEQIRLSVVCRILQMLEWDIWDPKEVYPEFIVAPNEDGTKVDIALFENKNEPAIFIEVKAPGKIEGKLSEVERQLRNYNRDNMALFSIITDGRKWHLYYSQTRGEFSRKCFKVIDLLTQDLDDLEISFLSFLRKSEILNGKAKIEAENYLTLSQEQKTMEDCLPQAKRMVNEPPFISLPECLISLVKEKGFLISLEKAISFIDESRLKEKKLPESISFKRNNTTSDSDLASNGIIYSVETQQNDDIEHTHIIDGHFNNIKVSSWNKLNRAVISFALSRGMSFEELNKTVFGNFKKGDFREHGFKYLPDVKASVQDLPAPKCLQNALFISERFRLELFIKYIWEEKGKYPGKEGSVKFPSN